MQNSSCYVDISLNSDINYVKIDDVVNIDITIKNNSKYIVHNGLLHLNIDKEIFELEDKTYEVCIDDFAAVGDINPGDIINIKIPVKVKNIPTHLSSGISCSLNYHIMNNNDFVDLNEFSKEYYMKFNYNNILSENRFKYSVDKKFVHVNDIITHTIILSNEMNVELNNILLSTNSINNLDFIPNSLKVNSICRIGESIYEEIELGSLDYKETIIIEFKTLVNDKHKHIKNSFKVEYEIDNVKSSTNSNLIEIKLLSPEFENNFSKTISKQQMLLDDIVDFKIEIENIGDGNALDVILIDYLPKNLEYIENSLRINGIKNTSNIFEEGINFEKIKPSEKIVIIYKAKSRHIGNITLQAAKMLYLENINSFEKEIISNCLDITINGAKIGNNNITKQLSLCDAQIGDIITSTILIENTGNIDCESLKLYDKVNTSLEFIEDSLYIDGFNQENVDIFNGVTIDRIKPSQIKTISYQVKVLDLPKPNPIVDVSTLQYSYINGGIISSSSVKSNKSKIYVNNPVLYVDDIDSTIINDSLSKIHHDNNNDIKFNLFIENRGNVGLEDIYLKLPKELIVNKDSIKINKLRNSSLINNKIYLNNLNVSQQMNIEFCGKYKNNNNFENIECLLYFEYSFRGIESKEYFTKVQKLKENIILVNPNLHIEKNILNEDVELGEELVKCIKIKNIGNIDFFNIEFDLNEPEFLEQLNPKYFIDSNEVNKEDIFYISTLKVNDEKIIHIRYKLDKNIKSKDINKSFIKAKYKVLDEIKEIKEYSNNVKLNLINPSLNIIGKSSSQELVVDENYTYFLTLSNKGNIKLEYINLNVLLPECIKFVSDSLFINNKKIINQNSLTNIQLDNLNLNESIYISFDFKLLDKYYNDSISIQAKVNSQYKSNNIFNKKTFEFKGDKKLIVQNISLDIVKCVSETCLEKKQTFKVQNILNNLGNKTLNEILLKDNADDNLTFIQNSVFIDGENINYANPIDGILIDKINPYENVLITYEYKYTPKILSNRIKHFSDISYSYYLDNGEIKSKHEKSETIYLNSYISVFKQFDIGYEYMLDSDEEEICEIVNVFTNAMINDYYVIDSSKDEKKVIIRGTLIHRIEYLGNKQNSSLYLIEKNHPFTSFINIAKENFNENMDITVKCEDVFYKLNNRKCIFISNLICIEGNI